VSILVTLTVFLVWWIAAWAFGVKAFDAFMLPALAVVTAAAAQLAAPFVNQLLGREQAAPDQLGPPRAPGT
jgi:hypothetical protein